MIFDFWIFRRGCRGEIWFLTWAVEWGLALMSQWSLCAPELWPLVNTSVCFPAVPWNPPSMRTRHPGGAPSLCLFSRTTKSLVREYVWVDMNNTQTLMSSPCMQTACSTLQVLMYVNVINNWIIIITLLVSKETEAGEESGHHRAFSMKGLMCSLSYCNASVNINRLGRHLLQEQCI